MSVATLRYTSTVELSAAREAAAARREAQRVARVEAARRELERRLPGVEAMVREEGDCFGVKVRSTTADWRASGWSAEMVARLILDPETDVEYWPIPE
jgi:hypothetical protein